MRKFFHLVLFTLFICTATAQNREVDSLKNIVTNSTDNVLLVDANNTLSRLLKSQNPEEALRCGFTALDMVSGTDTTRKISILKNIAFIYLKWNAPEKSIEYYLQALTLQKSESNDFAYTQVAIGNIYFSQTDYKKAQEYYKIAEEIFDKNTLWTIHSMLSELLENRAVIQHALLGRDIADDDIHSKAIAVRKELDICDFQDEKEIEED